MRTVDDADEHVSHSESGLLRVTGWYSSGFFFFFFWMALRSSGLSGGSRTESRLVRNGSFSVSSQPV